MLVNTRIFGEIAIEDEKILTFEQGLFGFEEYSKYAVVYDTEKQTQNGIMWLQSIENGNLAFPVMNPLLVEGGFNPVIEDEWLAPIGEFQSQEDIYVLAILTVPADITRMSVNLKAPLIINSITRKGCQLVVNNEEYKVTHEIYDYFRSLKEKEAQ